MNLLRVASKFVFATTDSLLSPLGGPRILIYHQVGSGRPHEMNVSVEVFRSQLDWMQARGEVVGLDEALRRRGDSDSRRLFVLTFDDGYKDVFANAFPLLLRRQIPFTLYLTSGPIERPGDFNDWPGEPMTWNQVRQMLESGLVTVGAHTDTHPDLRYLDPTAAKEEILRSNETIEDRCDVLPRHFTYPWGYWAAEADPIVRATYASATLGSGSAITAESDLYTLHRLPIQRSDPALLFGSKVARGARSEDCARRILRQYGGP